MHLYASRTRFVQYKIAFCNRPETASDVISGMFVRLIVHNKRVKFRGPRFNRSRESPPEAVGGVIFGRLSNVDNFRPEVVRYVISGVIVYPTSMDVPIKLDDSNSKHSRDIRLPHFVTDDR